MSSLQSSPFLYLLYQVINEKGLNDATEKMWLRAVANR